MLRRSSAVILALLKLVEKNQPDHSKQSPQFNLGYCTAMAEVSAAAVELAHSYATLDIKENTHG